MTKLSRWLPVGLFFAMIALLGVGLLTQDPNAIRSARVGERAPDVQLDALPGKPEFLRNALDTQDVKLVNFWASWCAPCRVEHAQLMELAGEGVAIYGVNHKDPDTSKALGFLADLGDPYTGVGADARGRGTAVDWGVVALPETFVVDGQGVVQFRFAGPITPSILKSTIRPEIAKAQ